MMPGIFEERNSFSNGQNEKGPLKVGAESEQP